MLTKTHSLNCIWAFQLAFADLVFPGMAGFAAYRCSLALFLSLLLSFSCVCESWWRIHAFSDAFFPPRKQSVELLVSFPINWSITSCLFCLFYLLWTFFWHDKDLRTSWLSVVRNGGSPHTQIQLFRKPHCWGLHYLFLYFFVLTSI